MYQKLTSHKNPRIKNLITLQTKSRERRNQNLFVIEGIKETRMAVESGYTIDSIFFSETLIDKNDFAVLMKSIDGKTEVYEVDKDSYEKIAYRDSVIGFIAIVQSKNHELKRLKLSSNPLVLVLESVEKPGNIGAVIRTVDAASVDAVILCNPVTDVYNPNIIRSSVGCIFSTCIAVATTEETIDWLKEKKISVFPMTLMTSTHYHTENFKNPSAFIIGTESTGLTDRWMTAESTPIKIPMLGKNDSLNVSTSAAIVLFEAKRQRNFK